MGEIFNRNNFHRNTFCIFREASPDAIQNLKPNYKSKSGSIYYFTDNGVYRLSNHWGRAANCKWRLQTAKPGGRTKLGFALWSAFHRDNDAEKLYFIEWSNGGVHFQHKDNGSYGNQLLRTASETTRRIRQIRNLLENNSWTKYYAGQNPESLTQNVIDQMIATDKTLQQIKAALP